MKLFTAHEKNAGDVFSWILLPYLRPDIKFEKAACWTKNKLLATGSILECAVDGDTVWGSGLIKINSRVKSDKLNLLALRGSMSHERLSKRCKDVVYGDPGLLVSRLFNPEIEVTNKVGFIPHYCDYNHVKKKYPSELVIDITEDIFEIIRKIKSCDHIVSSSLHGIVFAEAYGIPTTWKVWSHNVIGNGFKFRDYLSGTDRKDQWDGDFPPIPDLPAIQNRLLNSLNRLDTILQPA